MTRSRFVRTVVLISGVSLSLVLLLGAVCICPWLCPCLYPCNGDDEPAGGSRSGMYYQDIDIGGDPDPNQTFDMAITYIEPTSGTIMTVFTGWVYDPWHIGQSRVHTIGGHRHEVQLLAGTDFMGEPTRIVRLISPFFNRFLVEVHEVFDFGTPDSSSTTWREFTDGPVENGVPVIEPYSDRDKIFFGDVRLVCSYIPGGEYDYLDKFIPPFEQKYGDSNVIDEWVDWSYNAIEPGVFRWSALTRILTEEPTPVVIDSIPPGPYDITYEGRSVYIRGHGSEDGLVVQVGDIEAVADVVPGTVYGLNAPPAKPAWYMTVEGFEQGWPIAQVYLIWNADIVVGQTYPLNGPEVAFDGVLYDSQADKCYAFAHVPGLAGEGTITFLQFSPVLGGTVALSLNWSGYARQTNLPYCMGPPSAGSGMSGELINATVRGTLLTNNCCLWPEEDEDTDPE